ncbi:MAG: hypothetical protein R3E98_02850 [Gemmatimonadota bacterium]|nr:hypothetical protein [Gemmatimonadota bacterium]
MADLPYRPIACAVHDRLEHLTVRGAVCRIRYELPDGTSETVDAAIQDLLTDDGAEYAVLSTGQRIRLDHIRSFGPAAPGPVTPSTRSQTR